MCNGRGDGRGGGGDGSDAVVQRAKYTSRERLRSAIITYRPQPKMKCDGWACVGETRVWES